jgi:hypothetical protein
MREKKQTAGPKKILLAMPDNPYRVLDVPFDADAKAVNTGLRTLFRKDPRRGGRIGNRAQKKLTDLTERVKEDVFCREVKAPVMDLDQVDRSITLRADDVFSLTLEDLTRLSDVYFMDLGGGNPVDSFDLPDMPYRQEFDTREM